MSLHEVYICEDTFVLQSLVHYTCKSAFLLLFPLDRFPSEITWSKGSDSLKALHRFTPAS